MAEEPISTQWLRLFRGTQAPELFVRDLESLLALPADAQNEVVALLRTRDTILAEIQPEELRDLEQRTGSSRDALTNGFDVVRFLLREIATSRVSVEQAIEDLRTLGRSDEDVATVGGLVRSLLDTRTDLVAEVRKTRHALGTLDTVDSLAFAIDFRAVEEDDEVVDLAPVLIVRMGIDGRKEDVVFQLNQRLLGQFVQRFSEQQAKLEAAADRVSINPTGRGTE